MNQFQWYRKLRGGSWYYNPIQKGNHLILSWEREDKNSFLAENYEETFFSFRNKVRSALRLILEMPMIPFFIINYGLKFVILVIDFYLGIYLIFIKRIVKKLLK